MNVNDLSVAEVRSSFSYDPRDGMVYRNKDGKPAVSRKGGFSYVSIHSTPVMASRVIYILLHGELPHGLRTKYLDGDTANLRRANLEFMVSSTEQKGKPRTLPKILDTMAKLGGRASTPMIRAAAGLSSTLPLAAYMKVLEGRGEVHVCGIDEEHTAATGRQTLMWQLGKGNGRPELTRAITHEMIRRRKHEVSDEEVAKRRAHAAVAAAKRGAIANSIFAVGARLI